MASTVEKFILAALLLQDLVACETEWHMGTDPRSGKMPVEPFPTDIEYEPNNTSHPGMERAAPFRLIHIERETHAYVRYRETHYI